MGRVLRLIALVACFSLPSFSDTVLSRFKLFNEEGAEAPSTHSKELHSLGALIVTPTGGAFATCSVTHLSLGKVLTAAHCLALSENITDYHLIFYTLEKKRRVIPVEKILFKGPPSMDVAVLTISKENALTWQTAGNEIKREPPPSFWSKYWGEVNKFEYVNIWGFKPEGETMHFKKNWCLSSRTVPIVEMRAKDVGPEKNLFEWQFGTEDFNPEHSLFMDNCLYPIEQGNSGSLVASPKNFNEKIAVLSSFVPEMDKVYAQFSGNKYKDQEIRYYYRGIDSKSVPLEKEKFKNLVIGIGALLEPAKLLKPGLFDSEFK